MPQVPGSHNPTPVHRRGGTGGAHGVELPVTPQRQPNDSPWCWAAVAVMVNNYFGRGPSVRQCELVGWAFNQPDCCHTYSVACNRDYSLRQTLIHLGLLLRVTADLSEPDLVRNLRDRRAPLGVRIASYGGGHFVVAKGYEDGATGFVVSIIDPLYGDGLSPYTRLRSLWTHCYETR